MSLFRPRRRKRPLSYEEHVGQRAQLYEAELRSGEFEVVQIDPARTLEFLGRQEPLFYPEETAVELRDRRSAQLAFYRLCRERTLDPRANPYLEWMRTHHADGSWHGARSEAERIVICERHRDLFQDVEKNRIRMPLRILQEKHFHLTDVKRAADGGNRLQIAVVLGLPTVPNLLRRDLIAEARAHGLL